MLLVVLVTIPLPPAGRTMLRMLKNASDHLPKAVTQSIGFLLGPQAAELCCAGMAKGTIDIPSTPTLSRARLKADVLLMRLRSWAALASLCKSSA